MSQFEIIDLKQNTPEWLKFRKNHIGASDAPVIAEVSPWKTPYSLWQEKLGLINSNKTSSAMERGLRLEDEARLCFSKLLGIEFSPMVLKSKDSPWMCASYDGLSSDLKCGVEIKCPGDKTHKMALDGEIPEYYIPQLVHQMIVAGLDKIFYFSYNEKSFKIIEFYKNIDLERDLIQKETIFWDCLYNLKEPKLLDRDYVEFGDEESLEIATEWKVVERQLKQLEAREKALRKMMIDKAGDSCVRIGDIKLTRYSVKGRVDYTAIPELKGVDLECYRKEPSTAWRIS